MFVIDTDIIELILSNLDYTHKQYIRSTSSVSKNFYICTENIILKKFEYESNMLKKINIKLNNHSIVDFNVKSVDEFKSKNDYEIILATTKCDNFNDFNEIFYCDCNKCYNTLPCGRGEISPYDYDEYKFLYVNFSNFNWWIKFYDDEDWNTFTSNFDMCLKNEGLIS
tara:strand:+ start:963 stop:1466 length:504 start_codon:yes stop_codon:yes gene_type:complete